MATDGAHVHWQIMTAIRERFLSNPLLGPHYAFTDPAGYHMTLTGLEVQGFKLVSGGLVGVDSIISSATSGWQEQLCVGSGTHSRASIVSI
jgi:hypothetical protein